MGCGQLRLMDLPDAAWVAVARALGGAHNRRALRATCRRMRSVADVATTQVRCSDHHTWH